MNRRSDKQEDLVSIIIPTYNCGDFIGKALDSILQQTYMNYEAIIIDDCSTDNTAQVAKGYENKDSRFKYYRLNNNLGAAAARNKGIELANGKYIAFLDADDVWFSNKLSKQIEFMKHNKYNFTCTSYTKINKEGVYLNATIRAKNRSDYNDILKRCPGNSTVIYNAEMLGKFRIPEIRKRNDYVMWLQIAKREKYLFGLDQPLGSHRLRKGALSRSKVGLIKYHWIIYRKIENLSVVRSFYLICYWTIATILRLR